MRCTSLGSISASSVEGRRQELAYQRCASQGLTRGRYSDVAEVVEGLLGVQAQELGPSRWSLAQRLRSATDDDVRAAIASGAIVRVHVLRPTWHYVLGADLRWLQALTRGAVKRGSASWYRNHGVDERFLAATAQTLVDTLSGGRHLTRDELREALGAAGHDVSGQRLTIALFDAELETVVCSGPMTGRHHTYALVDERVPPSAPVPDDEATARLMTRYLRGHGPASLDDLRWWCNLTLAPMRAAVAALGDVVSSEEVDGVTYLWLSADEHAAEAVQRRARPAGDAEAPRFQLLEVFDELFTGYRQTRGLVDPDGEYGSVLPLAYTPLPHLLLEGERLAGQWRTDRSGASLRFTVTATRPLSREDEAALLAEARRYAAFNGRAVELVLLTA